MSARIIKRRNEAWRRTGLRNGQAHVEWRQLVSAEVLELALYASAPDAVTDVALAAWVTENWCFSIKAHDVRARISEMNKLMLIDKPRSGGYTLSPLGIDTAEWLAAKMTDEDLNRFDHIGGPSA